MVNCRYRSEQLKLLGATFSGYGTEGGRNMNDVLLRRALEAKVRAVEPSDEMLMNIHREANRRKKEEKEKERDVKRQRRNE